MTTRRTRERALVAGLSATLVALAGIVLALWLTGRRTPDAAAVAPLVADAIERIAIERPERPTLVLERRTTANVTDATGAAGTSDEHDWWIVEPCAIDAIDARITPFLQALATRASTYAADDIDLAAAGLVAPLAVVRTDGTETALGGTDLGGERRYAMSDGQVSLVPEWVLSLADGGLSALAEPVAFPAAPAGLRRLGEEPGVLDPTPWAGLAASQIVAWPVPDAPPATRRARLEVTSAAGAVQTLELIGNASWNALLTRDGACARLFTDADLPSGSYP